MECTIANPLAASRVSEGRPLDGQQRMSRLLGQLLQRNVEAKGRNDVFSAEQRHSPLRGMCQPPPIDLSRVVFSGIVQLGRGHSTDTDGTGGSAAKSGIPQRDDSTLTVLRDCKEPDCPRFAKVDDQCLLHHAQDQDQGQVFSNVSTQNW